MGGRGMTRSQLKSRKGSVSKSIPAAEVAHTDHVLDVEDENPRSKKNSNSVSFNHITRTPDVRTTKVLLEQNPGRSARGNNSNKSKPVPSAKRSLTFSDENVNPKRQKLDQKRYGNTSRVVPFTESCSPSTASKGASQTVNSSNISSKSNSEENEEEREEHWDYSGSELDTDKEWKPEGGSEHSSEDGLELSGVESVHSTPLRIQDGGLLGITSNENEGDEISSDSETHKKTAKEMRSERKDKRNSGQAYTSTTGKEIAARIRKPVPPCKRRKCHLIISEDTAESIFNEYWEQSSYDKRVNYICNRIESYTVQRRRARNGIGSQPHPKNVSYKYYFDVGGVRHSVCKDTFLCTLGETDRFLRECARKKKTTLSGIAPDDARGKKKPKHSLKVVLKKKILTHINSYPAYVSHYCRRQTKQKYLPHTLNLKIMCEQFNAQQKANAEEYTDVILSEEEDADDADQNAATIERAAASTTVSYSTYRRVFSSLNLKFKVPASDTCSTCDTLKMKIKLTKDDEEKQKLTEKHELHLRRAEAAYSLKRQFKAKAKEDNRVGCLIFDLEQVLPTPSVSTGVAYYLRQLNTYNLTIVDASTNITYCYMWHEGEAARGANQIASALYHHIKCEVPDTVEELYLFSDCCSGQNRNSIVSSMFQVLLSMKPSLKSINHIFLIPGHTRMECDTKRSLIERQKKKTATIDVPRDWYNLVRNTSSSFKVTEMAQKFYNFESLTSKDGPLIMREKKEDGSKMYWTKTVWFQYSEPGLVKVKASYNTTAGFDELNMIRGTAKNRRLQKNWWKSLSKCNPVNKISEEKKKNLMSLMQYVDSEHHEFYQKLVTDPSIDEDHDPDLPSDNEDDIEED
ncbi:Proline--tRNA ligase [Frankliniella fusca]|uniref:Proline--tRNA ligase n=1 Tax=Frankliniella fusca TaxID=407009 RepID=A0AAE1I380_9NEOP|nr:Proline--tRNA ligase [Frankliniella fusca]